MEMAGVSFITARVKSPVFLRRDHIKDQGGRRVLL